MSFARGTRAALGAAVAVIGALAGSLLTAGPALAAVPACGASITTSIVLTGDMLNCPGIALRVDASNVVIDLNGHTIDGPGATQNGPSGVRVGEGRTGVTVQNGRIQEFAFGVGLGNSSSGADVTGLQLVGNGGGVVTVSNVMGVFAVSNNNRIHANQIVGNTFQGVTLVGNGNRVDDNDVSDNATPGIRIGFASAPTSSGNLVENNRLVRDRVLLNNATDTVVRSNQTNGTQLTGILVTDSPRTTVVGNQSSYNGDGIGVQGGSAGTVLSGNAVFGNSDDGIDVSATGVTVTGNFAYQNRDFGITAVAGTTDGGGNKAFANGNPQQCTPNIVCT